ncbi:hypothetical protein [Nonomuraea aurantiaca]|uniref:hypothetical protein n=1 Tax=Nonomuraea aurantiaca TaxID=2878562 RepID=UPI001CD96AA3|nr:hypothetical protein [Nonomuraea aurantiaca]MCA2230187.1 hypothetical protein [Nonomuraea aurantiaca]
MTSALKARDERPRNVSGESQPLLIGAVDALGAAVSAWRGDGAAVAVIACGVEHEPGRCGYTGYPTPAPGVMVSTAGTAPASADDDAHTGVHASANSG